jgi:hypothetical protein
LLKEPIPAAKIFGNPLLPLAVLLASEEAAWHNRPGGEGVRGVRHVVNGPTPFLNEGAEMTREVINPPELPAVNPTYSQAIRANGFVYVAGQIGIAPATGSLISAEIAEQARQAIAH